jgi:hypothetical protein
MGGDKRNLAIEPQPLLNEAKRVIPYCSGSRNPRSVQARNL